MLNLADAFEALTNTRPLVDTIITEAAIDSRQVIPGSLFIAIPGERVDGHEFVADAFQRGASVALIQHDIPSPYQTIQMNQGQSLDRNINITLPLCLKVENSVKALQQIAHFWRRKINLKVIGITGSVGKSTTKEVIAEVLEQRFPDAEKPR